MIVPKPHASQPPPADEREPVSRRGADAETPAAAPPEAAAHAAGAGEPAGGPEGDPVEAAQSSADDAGDYGSGDDVGDVSALRRRIGELETLNRELSDRYLRLVAEFDNYRRRARQNEETLRATATEALIVDLLPVLDHLHMAIAAAGEALSGPFGQGVSLIYQQLNETLARYGLQTVETKGRPFDPNTMEAVARAEPSEDTPEGHVVEEYRRGYHLNGKLLRASQVKVAQAE